MELGPALVRLGFNDQEQPTVADVNKAYDDKMTVADKQEEGFLLTARKKVLEFAPIWDAQKQAMRERIEEMRVLTYENIKPMDLNGAIREFGFECTDTPDEKEINDVWEKKIEGTIPKEGHAEERMLNKARDMLLDRLKEPEYQEAMCKAKALKEAEALRKAEALLAKEAEAEALRATQTEVPRDAEAEGLQAEKSIAEQDKERLQKRRKRLNDKDTADANRMADALERSERADEEFEKGWSDIFNASNTDRAKKPRGPEEEPNERPTGFIGRPAKKPESGKKKHRPTDPDLKAEMERVFAERFEKKHGQNVSVKEVYDIFEASTSLPKIKHGAFKRNCRTMFLSQWTHSRVIFKGNGRFYTDMAVKLE